jgi:hypothetical protein
MMLDRVLGERGNSSGYEGISLGSKIGVVAMAVWSLYGDAVQQRGGAVLNSSRWTNGTTTMPRGLV